MFIHERRVSELGIETKFEVCDPRTVFFYYYFEATYEVTRNKNEQRERPEKFRPFSLRHEPSVKNKKTLQGSHNSNSLFSMVTF